MQSSKLAQDTFAVCMNALSTDPAEVSVPLLQMDSGSHAMQQEGEKAEARVAEQGSSEHACCELCEQAGHNKEDCPLVVAAQESEASPEAEEADLAGCGWQDL